MKRWGVLALGLLVLSGCRDATQPVAGDVAGTPASQVTPPACTTPPSGLVSWWPLDETSGTAAADIVDANAGLHIGAPTPVAGKVAGALSFDGGTDFVEVSDAANLDITNEITIDAWIKPTESKLGGIATKFSSRGSCSRNSFADSWHPSSPASCHTAPFFQT